ncbi:sacsin-like isoform X2 [Hemibagrus wyckioides]|uniref:sacsin-like isoform X2 n=1 Tax=Hemibagrus wyckioides TaxID=337641 RepID=UPI00266C027F|nr:sacsin-like isoform X2 [Hemibagrus wyckioides]
MSLPQANKKKIKKNAFGATAPPFIDYLKEILRRYPDGGQILKELIQNADDAGASKTVFIHDERRYGTGSVWNPALGKYQGPALYAFNDADFTEEDWEGIQRAGRSIKHDDPTKVGRFGIGFNSVYHVTDLPCVLSSKHLAVFDPQKQMFDDDREGYRWSLDDEEDRKHLLEFTDQFKPFQDIVNLVCENDGAWEKIINESYFKGTLFRFPLRHEASEISDNLYDSKKATQLFDSFIPDADISVLFLRSVISISLWHIDSNGRVTIRMNVSASSPSSPLQESDDFRRNCLQSRTSFKTVSCSSPCEEKTTTKWLVRACRLTEGCVPEIDALAGKLSFYPQVDIAFQCDEDRACGSGRLSCFLPLPNNETNMTGLPVHINACFGLTDNRRYIKWQEEDQKNDESAEWNELLMKEVLPHVYLKIIQDSIQLSRESVLPVSAVYHLWPDLRETEHRPRWNEVAGDLFQRLFKNQEIFSLAKNEKEWVAASDAVFPNDYPDTDIMSAVFCLLMEEGENLVTAPDHVLLSIKRTFPNPDTLKWVTPGFVRSVLHRSDIDSIGKDKKLSILEYVLSDGRYEELNGLQLLPLSDGSFRSFTNREEDTALIDNEKFSRVLLPFCKERFLPDDLNRNTAHHLRRMAMSDSKLYQLINLDANNVAAFAKKHLPKDWKETKGHVRWNSVKDDHPPKTWLKEFWKFLNTHWTELRDFIGMPLIPLEPLEQAGSIGMLARLEEKSTLIFQRSREFTLSDQMQKVVKATGGTVIKKDECLKHHDIESYVLTPSPRNVLQILLNSDKDKVVNGIASLTIHEKEEFKAYISSLDCVSDVEQGLLSALPIFRLMSEKYVAIESKQAVILMSNPAIPRDLPVPNTTVQCANEADRRLLTLLKVELLDAAQLAIYLVDCIDDMLFNKEDEQKIMAWILNNGHLLFSQSEELLMKSKNLSFILTDQGERKRPSSVFDHTNKTFLDLFEEDFFPPQVYRSPKMLESLKQLGLQTKEEELSPANVLHVASQIQNCCTHSQNSAFKKAHVLVRILNKNDLLSKFSEEERQDLLQLQWVPCENPNQIKSKRSQKRYLYKPTEIRSSKYSAIVGHVMPLVSDLNESICQKLDLNRPPPSEKVLENLGVLISLAPTMVNPDRDCEFKNKLHSTYKFMQENTEHFRKEMNNKCIPWLWSQTEFVSPREVVLSYPAELDLSLYIKEVEDEFLQYEDLLREWGVKETLSDEEIEAILSEIKDNIDGRTPPYGEPSELKLSTAILDWMRKNEKTLKDSTPVPVKAQNQNFTLQPLKNTVFCDISDDGLEDLKQDKEEFYVIHEEVLPITARWMKVPFLSTRILKPQIIGIEQCGQTEPITQRIKNILKEYDDESDIFKELIQNAEDAGASTCGFMLDFRTHPSEGLIDDGMALCNGPCLWAFNNELFSEDDWKNIVRVGSASKENKLEKIGKFGLGFNAVYHVTDIPSILSGKSLLILDPNVTHLEKHIHSKSNPGIKLDLFQERLFRRFPGQFKSYQGIFDCDLSNSNQKYYNGTLIKLPFRTAEEACKSEISSKVYDIESINAFQQHLTDSSLTSLLFIKHMKLLFFQIFKQGPIETVLKISKEVVCSIKISNEQHLQAIREALNTFDTNCHKIVDCFAANIVEIDCECAERTSTQSWFLYSCIGTKDSLRMFQREEHQCKFSLPIGGVAVPLQRESDNTWSTDERLADGQAFCFLPLPIDTGLPVHINGSFAVTSNRKALWESGKKLEWNKALLQDAVATAYITTLLELKKISQNGSLQNYDYYKFWPNIEEVNKAFQTLVSAFYSAIVQSPNVRSLELLSNGKTWCSFDNARFLDPSIQENEAVGKLAMEVFLKYTEPNYCAVPLPAWVRHNLIQCGFSEMVKERTFSWFDFYQLAFKNLSKMDAHCRNALILNAIDLNDHKVDTLLKSNACIPTQKVKTLQFTNKLVNPHGKVACLYEPEEGRFLDDTKNDYFTPERMHRLSGLGMLTDVLTLEEVIERAKTISQVWAKDKNTAYKRLQCLFDSMKKSCHVESLHWETLKHTAFLPAVGNNQHNEVMTILKKPSEIYVCKCEHLVNMTEFTVDVSKLGLLRDDPVLTKLGVMKNPPIGTVLRQLKEVHHHVKSFENSVLLNIAKSCYDYLNKYLLNDGDPTAILEHAQSIPFVLIEDHFVNVRSVAIGGEFEAKPYLYFLPTILSKFENLWNCVGIKTQFTAEQFVAVLEEISTFSKPLKKRELHVCLDILIKGLYGAAARAVENCLMPDERSVLTNSSKLKFNDTPWMPVQAGVTLCHKLIPREVACCFGVVTTRHHTLQNHLVSEFSPFAKEFGQHEKLTVRIKNIIEAYPAKKDILKELIQNADDAEATEIHFVWDKRKHGTTKTFGKRWELLQGPALCVYNNKKFSNEDLIGIQQLGEGGKHGTLGRTGKYGLGFNSVYQLTDCPSILSGDEYLCISDPNLKYVEAGKMSPGCMYSMDEIFKKSFHDVYHTFLPERFPLNSGTMFRFPLRTEEMAAKSEISRNAVRDYEIMELVQALKSDPEELILFLKYITKIHYHEINKDGSEGIYFVIEKKVTESTMEQREGFHNHVRNSLKSGTVIPRRAFYTLHITSGKKESHWIIAEQYGSFLQNQEEGKVPQAGLAACLGTKPTENQFYGKAFCSLPLPGITGLPVHVNGNFEVDHSRRDLWKEDGESSKTRWNQLLQLKTIAPLYADLLTILCAISKKDEPKMIEDLKSHMNFCLNYFPFVSKEVVQAWHDMINEVYRSINQRNLPVIPTLESVTDNSSHGSGPKYTFNWSSVSKPNSTDSPHFTTESHNSILQVLEHTGMNLVPYSWPMEKVWQSFKTAGVEVAEVSPLSVISYLKKKRMNDLSQSTDDLPLPINQTLIKDSKACSNLLKFCLSNADKESWSVDLNGLPLLLTQDQMLRKFSSNSLKLISQFADIFKEHKSEFADYQVNSCHKTILQKGKYIEKLSIPVAAKFIKPVLQQLLQHSLLNETNRLHTAGKETKEWLKQLWNFFDNEAQVNDSQGFPFSKMENRVFSEIKKHFYGSPILPVIYPGQKETCFLQKIENLHSVVYNPKEHISAILIKLGSMTLDLDFFLGLRTFVYRYVQPELLNITDSSAVLKQLDTVSHSEFEKLSGDESDELQLFLQSGSTNTNEYQRMFKSLPLFQTICGKRQRINFHSNIYILNTVFQETFPGLFMFDHSGCIFLKHNRVNVSLSKCLNIKILDDLKYCVKFVIPSVHKLNHTQLLDLIRLLVALSQRSDYKDHKDSIALALRDVRFILDINGYLQKASYFFDEEVNLYEVMLPKDKFVPKTFWKLFENSKRAKSFIKNLGLKHKVSEEDIIAFANQIESDAKGDTELQVLKHRSASVLKTALRLADEKKSKLMQRIATIKFIVAVQIGSKLCDYHNAFAQGRDMIAIKESLLEKQPYHQYLIWTTMPILPSRDFNSKELNALRMAGALDEPPSQQVMQNLKNICRSQCRTKQLVETRATVFKISYAYLQSVHFNESVLANVPLVLVENDTYLVKASQALLTLPNADEFRPYLYPIQPKHAMYAEFFKKIGVDEKPTVRQFCTVLEEIYTECCDKTTLQPNQQKTVQRVVQQLFMLINKERTVTDFQNITLYLPSTDGKLYESSTLFFNDTFFQANRLEDSLKTKLKLLVKLNECHLKEDLYEHQKLLQLLPKESQPKLLSQVISVNLVSTLVEDCDYGKSCEFSGWFEKRLSSREFHHGLICLIRHQTKGTITQAEAAHMCEKIFGKIQIVCCKNLITELLLNHQPLEGTETETQVYVEKQQDECVFYLKHNDNMALKVVNEVNMYLTKEINALLQNSLNSLSLPVLGHLLLCENLEDVKRALEQHGVRNTANDGGLSFRPSPGTPIPEEWHDSLDMDLLNNFEKGEYVGFSNDELENEYIFAIVVECLDQYPGQTKLNPSRYRIQIGDENIIEVSSLDLYQFKREKGSGPIGNVTCRDINILTNLSWSVASHSEPSQSAPSPKRPLPQTLKKVKTEIDQSLEEIWKMSDEDKSKAIRRLYLRWHPDKNPDNTDLASEAFKYLLNRIEDLQQGKTKHKTSTQPNTTHWANFSNTSTQPNTTHSANFSNFYDRWNYEARSHKRGRERFYQNNFRRQYNFWSHFQETPRPNKEEAKRWYRQAQCDLCAAQNDFKYDPSPEWCLFKVHQAVEKALIATELRRNGQHPETSFTIVGLAQKVSQYAIYLNDLPHVVNHLRTLGVDGKKTQYPNLHPSPHIPNGQFKTEDAQEAVEIATKLLMKLDKYITE